jgi:hypothetical protein
MWLLGPKVKPNQYERKDMGAYLDLEFLARTRSPLLPVAALWILEVVMTFCFVG